jgi:hypothetical protein
MLHHCLIVTCKLQAWDILTLVVNGDAIAGLVTITSLLIELSSALLTAAMAIRVEANM